MEKLIVNIREYELFENGQLVKVVKNSDEFYEYLDDYVAELRKNGYECLKERMGEYRIMVNYRKHDCKFIAYRVWFGFRDKDGRKIYEEDCLRNKDGFRVDIFENFYEKGTYTYRVFDRRPLESSDYAVYDMDFIQKEGVVITRSIFNF